MVRQYDVEGYQAAKVTARNGLERPAPLLEDFKIPGVDSNFLFKNMQTWIGANSNFSGRPSPLDTLASAAAAS